MKTKFIAIIAILAAAVSGCKNEKSVDALDVVKPEVVDNTFKVTIRAVLKKDDDVALFYNEDGSSDFKTEPMWQNIKGDGTEQQVTYTLPEGVFPAQFRIDLGLKKDQEDIVLRGITLEYKGKKREIAGGELGVYFRPDETKCSFDAASGVIKAVVTNGQRQIPSLYPQDPLKAEIEKLAQ